MEHQQKRFNPPLLCVSARARVVGVVQDGVVQLKGSRDDGQLGDFL